MGVAIVPMGFSQYYLFPVKIEQGARDAQTTSSAMDMQGGGVAELLEHPSLKIEMALTHLRYRVK